jgi:hypothetical protein
VAAPSASSPRILGDVAVATILYGLWLLSMIAFRG